MEKSDKKVNQHTIPLDILDDLSSRFIINIPIEGRQTFTRLCFQVEMAHWFYLDFYCGEDTTLKSCGMKDFSIHIFQHIPYLRDHTPRIDEILEEWRLYKQSVPTYGAILLSDDMSHVLLVQSFWAKSSWGFPKGKVNEKEDPAHCAIREVLEETGFDIAPFLDKDEYIESVMNEQFTRLYIITGVKMDTKFQPKTRNEIKSCEWFPLADLPTNRKDHTPRLRMGKSANAFFMALPFMKRLKRWVFEKTQKGLQQNRRQRNKSAGDAELSESVPSKVKLNKQQQQYSQTLGDEIQAFEDFKLKNAQQQSSNKSVVKKSCNVEKKPAFKRQLFNSTEVVKKGQMAKARAVEEFTAPSWLNFRFNKQLLLECFP